MSIIYQDNDKVEVIMATLIIRVKSINEHFGTINELADKYQLGGVTNGSLLLMAEMNMPAIYLYDIIESALVPNGMEAKKDYVIAYEQLTRGVDSQRNSDSFKREEIPCCKNINWLSSVVTKSGNWVWYKEPLAENE